MAPEKSDISRKGQWAQRLVRQMFEQKVNAIRGRQRLGPVLGTPHGREDFLAPISGELPEYEGYTWDNLPTDPLYEEDADTAALASLRVGAEDHPPRKICIVGAGIAGLYIAMILDDLKIPNLTYEILEANTRVGGRIYTHYFDRENPHDYCDIGAMRFPKIPIMDRTFDLFDKTKVPQIPYYLEGENCPQLFNDKLFEADVADPFGVSKKNGGLVPNDVVDNIGQILDDAFGPYKKKLKENFNEGFKELMTVDDFSTREYLKRGGPDGEKKYDFYTIQWAETQNTSSNLFDQAFSESVMDSFDFDYPGDEKTPDADGTKPASKNVEWVCIDGGTSLVTDKMENMLSTKVFTGKRVEEIKIDWEKQKTDQNNMSVKCFGEEAPRTGYTTVFNTTSLGCLARIDTQSLNLHPSVKDGIRCLHYDDSAKLALRFSYPWWIVDCKITEGGAATTDLPLRTCVYPSYNIHDDKEKPAVLLASYTWSQDATRVGSLVGKEEKERELVDLVLRDLAKLHAKHISYECIKKAYTGDYNVFSWTHDPFTSGAFALFGPGQFSHLYPLLSLPAADGKFHIVGEAASVHHAWVVGSLDSAVAAVHRFLRRFELKKHLHLLRERWNDPEEIEAGAHGTAHLQTFFDSLETGGILKK
ncbi:Fc.00g072650.m01.CDS01 [Cosmosporella sp. VM-42]